MSAALILPATILAYLAAGTTLVLGAGWLMAAAVLFGTGAAMGLGLAGWVALRPTPTTAIHPVATPRRAEAG